MTFKKSPTYIYKIIAYRVIQILALFLGVLCLMTGISILIEIGNSIAMGAFLVFIGLVSPVGFTWFTQKNLNNTIKGVEFHKNSLNIIFHKPHSNEEIEYSKIEKSEYGSLTFYHTNGTFILPGMKEKGLFSDRDLGMSIRKELNERMKRYDHDA